MDEPSENEIIEQRRIKRQRLIEELSHRDDSSSVIEGENSVLPVTANQADSSSKIQQKHMIRDTEAVTTKISKDGSEPSSEESEDDMFAEENHNKPVTEDVKVKASELHASLLDSWDDTDGYYRFIPGELLDGRYKVLETVGKGMFASVVRALDNKQNNTKVAIKIIRNNESMLNAGLKEAALLERLTPGSTSSNKYSPIVSLQGKFRHKGHLCLVFENLGANLRDVLKKYGRNEGINMKAVRIYANQLLKGLKLLREAHIIHADLKPDNILLSENHSILKIADLGSAIDIEDDPAITREAAPYLASRFYRAPELILGIKPFDYAVDMWALGCTLYEIYTGKLLFTGDSNNKMLKNIIETRGMFNNKLMRRASLADENFTDRNEFIDRINDKLTGKPTTKLLQLPELPKDSIKHKLHEFGRTVDEPMVDLNQFIDLLDRMLIVNPSRRITPDEASGHAFLVNE